LSKQIFSIWENINKDSFYIEENGVKYSKDQIDEKIDKLTTHLKCVCNWQNQTVYLDVNNRMLFMICFLTLTKLQARVVLVPTEIKEEDYIYNGGLFLSDNKTNKNGIHIDNYFNITTGNNFNPEKIEPPVTDNTVLYLYTSGSTGKAKLIPKTFLNLITEVEELKKNFNITENAVFYYTPPLYHIYGMLFGLLLPLYASAKIIIDYHFTPETIAEFVSNNKITHFISIPSYYRMFCDLNLIEHFKRCSVLFSSSAPLPIEISKSFYQNGIRITEVYGSTETGGIAYRTSAESEEWKMFSYVKIISNEPDYIENKEIMEFKIISPAISVDYNPDLGFNTGDVVKFYTDNKFILLGRNTRFEKISGKRVDLHYVMQKLRDYMQSFTDITIKEESLYIGVKNEKIYIISENKFPKTAREMKNDLKHHLPGYAIPKIFINEKIPRNNMGKINKIKINEIVDSKIKK
jgi:acyl-coenzyme A synthetase/AMP-(fatty) acid ligase